MSLATLPINFTTSSKMSQSDTHRELVLSTAHAIRQRHPNVLIQTDLQKSPGDPIPPLIGGYRPDIIGRCAPACPDLFIAEAKTDSDLERQHSLNQIDAFVGHLRTLRRGVGTFILTVDGGIADRARTVLRFTCHQHVSSRLCVHLFDGLDFWGLYPLGVPQWRLS